METLVLIPKDLTITNYAPRRGALVMNWQLFDAVGIFLGFTANLVASHIGPLSWRFQMASAFLPALCLLSLVWVIPESPRWLLKMGRLPEAFAALSTLRETPLQAAIELLYANSQIQVETSLLPAKPDAVRAEEGRLRRPSQAGDNPTMMQAISNQSTAPDEINGTGEITSEKPASRPPKERFSRVWSRFASQVEDSDMYRFQRRAKETNFWVRIW